MGQAVQPYRPVATEAPGTEVASWQLRGQVDGTGRASRKGATTRNDRRYFAMKRKPTSAETDLVFCTVYRHYRTGKLMRASDYGYVAWPFRVPRRK